MLLTFCDIFIAWQDLAYLFLICIYPVSCPAQNTWRASKPFSKEFETFQMVFMEGSISISDFNLIFMPKNYTKLKLGLFTCKRPSIAGKYFQ